MITVLEDSERRCHRVEIRNMHIIVAPGKGRSESNAVRYWTATAAVFSLTT